MSARSHIGPREAVSPEWRPGRSWRAPSGTRVDVWRVGLEDKADIAELVLSPEELQRMSRLRLEGKRLQFALTRSALRTILCRYPGVADDASSLDWTVGEHGKLGLLASPQRSSLPADTSIQSVPPSTGGSSASLFTPAVTFNVSHSGAMALIAVACSDGSPMSLGVDVETMRSGRPLTRIAARFFAPDEVAAFERLNRGAGEADFYRRWALKEAYLKALGTGLSYSSRAFSLVDDPVSLEPRQLLSACRDYGDSVGRWLFRNWWIRDSRDRYAAALCHESGEPQVPVEFYDAVW